MNAALAKAGFVRSLADRKPKLNTVPDQNADDTLTAIQNQGRREDKARVSLLDFRKLPNTCRFRLQVGESPI
jgi:hypothetical protein